MNKSSDIRQAAYEIIKERGPVNRNMLKQLVEQQMGKEIENNDPGQVISKCLSEDARFTTIADPTPGSKGKRWAIHPNFKEDINVND